MSITTVNIESYGDKGGKLISLESFKNIPFDIKRVYCLYDTKEVCVRGKHAHRNLQQFVFLVNGNCTISLDDGHDKKTFILDKPNRGILIKGIVWRELYNFTPGTVIMVLADQYYDENDYIRNYQEFKNLYKKSNDKDR